MRAVGIILAGGNSHRMKELTQKRAIGAMPIAGSFRSIDFVLSNMSNSHIQKVGVMTQFNATSLHNHLSSSKWWDFGRKQGGLTVLAPNMTPDNSQWFRGTADAIFQNIEYLKNCHEPYVIIASSDCVYKMDYNRLLEYHVEKKADITIVVKDMPAGSEFARYGTVRMNEESRIVDYEEKPIQAHSATISCGIYVIRRRLLIDLVEKCAQEDQYDLVRDILIRYRDVKKIFGFKMKDYWSNIASVEDYYKTNMDFLKPEVRKLFLHDYPSIYSKVDDLPPAKFNPGAEIRNSLISSGCIVNGQVTDSVIFKKSYIGNNCVIKNSIILNDVYIGDNVTIENCIIESRGTIAEGSTYIGEGDVKVVVDHSKRYVI